MNNLTIVTIATLLFLGCTPSQKQQPNDLENGTIKAVDSLTDSVELCETTYRVVEKMPYFPGGQIELAKHLTKLYGPIECSKGRLTTIGLIINKNGKVIGGIHKGFDGDCANRLNAKLSEMSNWVPGYNDDKPVCVQIEFDIADLLGEINEK